MLNGRTKQEFNHFNQLLGNQLIAKWDSDWKMVSISWMLNVAIRYCKKSRKIDYYYLGEWIILEEGYLLGIYKVRLVKQKHIWYLMLYEESWLIPKYAKRIHKNILDFHYSIHWWCCLYAINWRKLIEQKNLSILQFFEQFVFSYFYAVEYYYLNNKWVLPEYDHGFLWLIQHFNPLDNWEKYLILNDTLYTCRILQEDIIVFIDEFLWKKKSNAINTKALAKKYLTWKICLTTWKTLFSLRNIQILHKFFTYLLDNRALSVDLVSDFMKNIKFKWNLDNHYLWLIIYEIKYI